MRSWCLTATVICLIGSGIHGFEIEPEHHPQSHHGLRDKVVNVRAGGFLKNSNLTDYAREHLSRIAKSERQSKASIVTQANSPTLATPIASESAVHHAPELVLQHTYPEQAVMVPTLNSPAALSVPQPVAHAAPIGSTATHVLSPVISVQTPSPLQTPTVLPSSNTFEFAPTPVMPLKSRGGNWTINGEGRLSFRNNWTASAALRAEAASVFNRPSGTRPVSVSRDTSPNRPDVTC